MSDSTKTSDDENTSLLSNLKNTVRYNIHKKVYNPDANKFAKEQDSKNAKKAEEEKVEKKDKDEKTTELKEAKEAKSKQLTVKNVAVNVTTKVFSILAIILIPTMSILSAMLITNDMIMLPIMMRLIIFIAVIILFSINPFYSGGTLLVYIIKELHDRFTSGDKKYAPRIFALLPITTKPAETNFGGFFKWPFFYPKSEASIQKLDKIGTSYLEELSNSFTNFDTYKTSQPFSDLYNTLKLKMENMNKIIIPSAPNTA
jgi:hypothetical protein